MALPCGTTGSLTPGFPPARDVSLAVKLPYAFTLAGRFPFGLREPLRASVTLLEATAPVKLPTMQCPGPGSRAAVRDQKQQGWYFKDDSTQASAHASKSPTYPTHDAPRLTAKL